MWSMFQQTTHTVVDGFWHGVLALQVDPRGEVHEPLLETVHRREEGDGMAYTRLKRRPMLRQMRESMLRQTLHLRIAIDTKKIQSSDWPKWRCAL